MLHITNFARWAFWLIFTAFAGASLIFSSAFLYLSPNLPPVDALRDVQLQTPLRIYSREGLLIGEFGEKRRTPLNYQQIPEGLIHAILAAEDDGFFSHSGVDIKGLLRAASQLIATGSIQSGGSTITMQVAKNYFLTRERTFSRKFNEIFLALQIEQELSKQEILELYLNKIFLGNRAYGIEAAARVYYGKSVAELNTAQQAMIAGLPKAPSAYNPLANPQRALIRRNWILDRMHELGYINKSSLEEALNTPISAKFHGTEPELDAPYIAEMARQEMLDRYGHNAYTDGYKVFTTVSADMQRSAEKSLIRGLLSYDRRHGYRGPEQKLQAEEQDNHQAWIEVLAETPTLGHLQPAVVTSVIDRSLTALLRNGEQVAIEWDNGLQGFRPRLGVDNLGQWPLKAEHIAAVGDLIRVYLTEENQWRFSQVPDAQGALISIDSDNGGILALVGGFDYRQSKFNRVTQASRQPGSNFKPFIYTAALSKGYTAASIINDAPVVFDDNELESTWRPTNAGGKFLGPIRLRQALFQSRNLVSIRLLRSLGINATIDYIHRFGFATEQLPKDLSLALGSHSLTPFQIASAYTPFANGGFLVKPYLIDRIETLDGTHLYQAAPLTVCRDCQQETPNNIDQPLEEITSIEELLTSDGGAPLPPAPRVIDERVAYIIDDLLKDVVRRGTARKARSLNRNDLAGKTGTTNGPTDAWFSGYGGGIVTTTWVGFDNNQLLGRREYGGSAALPIWIDYMSDALQSRPEQVLPRPAGIVSVKIDPETGLLARPGQRDAIFEIFRDELTPREISPDTETSNPMEVDTPKQEDIF
jgi:penicillin-binding protein 1A